MRLYHYRSIESALHEIGDGTLHFASCDELNDPAEGYIRVYWQGDKPAWEGLFRNYICSLHEAIELYLLAADENILHHKTVLTDLNRYNDVPLGGILKSLGDTFLENTLVQKIAEFYGKKYADKRLKVNKEELQLILRTIHTVAFPLCIQSLVDHKCIPEEEAEEILSNFSRGNTSNDSDQVPAGAWFEKLSSLSEVEVAEQLDDAKRGTITKTATELLEDMIERRYIEYDDDSFLYGNKSGILNHSEPKDADKAPDNHNPNAESQGRTSVTSARQHRNWLSVYADFPKIYVEELREIIYPESFVVCFTERNDDSAMWGNYANHHKGVCLIYKAENESFALRTEKSELRLQAKEVLYEGELIERNFFNTLGRLTVAQIKTWLSGTDEVSEIIADFSDSNEWRKRYWAAGESKNYRKLKEWEHEKEYRIVLYNTFYQFNTPASRNLKYDFRLLKGVIFGIGTSEYDKKRVVDALLKHRDKIEDFAFYQAAYDEDEQKIVIRKKGMWELK